MKTGQPKSSNPYVVYILRCSDNSLYTGITNNLSKRLEQHNLGKGAKYTKGRAPVICVYCEECKTKSEALKREIELKSYTKEKKEELILKEDNCGNFKNIIQ